MPNPGRKDERPRVGPADDATRKRMLAEALGQKDPGTYAAKEPAAVAANPTAENTLFGVANQLKNRGKKIDQAVDDAS